MPLPIEPSALNAARLAPHHYTLDATALQRSLSHQGDPSLLAPLASRLREGQPVTIGVLGASVAQNGGCLTQPGKRCMAFRGVRPLPMAYGGKRPHKGFAVRLFDLLNRTSSHANHTLVNAALDGTPAQVMLPCLFTHLPTAVQLVVIEFGSLALHLHHPSVEAVVRQLLSLRPPPAIVFLTVRGLCKRTPARTNATVRYTLNSHWELYVPGERTAWSDAEDEFDRVCWQYNVGCLSLYKATIGPMLARAPGFALEDVSMDCLHPFNGRFGTEMLTDLLVNWLSRGLGLLARSATTTSGGGIGSSGIGGDSNNVGDDGVGDSKGSPLARELPLPLHAESKTKGNAESATCYSFAEQGRTASPISQAMRNVPWRTALCTPDGASCSQFSDVAAGCPFERKPRTAGAARQLVRLRGRSTKQQARSNSFVTGAFSSPQLARHGWGYCHHAQLPPAPPASVEVTAARHGRGGKAKGDGKAKGPAPKVSPGVAAIDPGAKLEALVDTRIGADGRADSSARIVVGVEHLTSYERMGQVLVSCGRHCSCAPHTIDAHRTSVVRNETVFTRHSFELIGAHERCAITLLLLNRSSSGGHKFKVRSVTLAPGASAWRRRAKRRHDPTSRKLMGK